MAFKRLAGSLVALGIVLPLLAAGAHAQDAPQSGPVALRRVAASCQAETARLCPALVQSSPSARNQVICLRPYRTSLSPGCRGAVNAALAR